MAEQGNGSEFGAAEWTPADLNFFERSGSLAPAAPKEKT
jgi:hypothetical protein